MTVYDTPHSTTFQKDETDRATEVGRRTCEQTGKWIQVIALRFQRGGRQTSPASLLGCTMARTKS